MGKSKDIIESMTDEELKILFLCFSKPKVVEAMRTYNTIPGHLKDAFIEPGKLEMQKRGITIPRLPGEKKVKKIEKRSD